MAQAYAKDGVNVNTIAPGVIDNNFHVVHTAKDAMAQMADKIPIRRFGRDDEVGHNAAPPHDNPPHAPLLCAATP